MTDAASFAPRRSGLDAARDVGARLLEDGRCAFRVWAPYASSVELVTEDPQAVHFLTRSGRGYHTVLIDGIEAGTLYRFRLDGRLVPDPASRSQPDGVHGPSAVVDHRFPWKSEDWRGRPLDEYVIYELHVGTFTDAGTLDAAADHVSELCDLGVTAVQLMPVAQFPGERNWGYDGVFPFAVQASYGGPHALKRFVDRCHEFGLAVILDVVYNHLGPEGNHLAAYGPYFTDTYQTPWGDALNFDGAYSDEVREFFIRNALQWVDEFRFDGLRLDAVHAIVDMSAQPFLRCLVNRIQELAGETGRHIVLIAESDLGDPRMIRPPDREGIGMDAQWLDDFHHALHALLTGERDGYYADFGDPRHLVRCYNDGFVYAGQYSEFRKRSHGAPAPDAAPRQFVVFNQNHDQVGNRMRGDRLTESLRPAALRLAAAATILSPFTPLLFMGEEYGETAPFPYFISHSDPGLVEAVRSGRRDEFAAFAWAGSPPDPQASETFDSARLRRSRRENSVGESRVEYYRRLLSLRRALPLPERTGSRQPRAGVASQSGRLIVVRYDGTSESWLVLLNFDAGAARCDEAVPSGRCQRLLDSEHVRWGGQGATTPDVLNVADGRLRAEIAPHAAVVLKLETNAL